MPRTPFVWASQILWIALGAASLASQQKLQPTQASAAAPSSDDAPLRALVDQFYAAYAQKDQAALSALWSTKSPDLEAQQKANEQFFAANDKIQIRNLTIQQLKVEVDKAHLRVSFDLSAVDAKTGSPSSASGAVVHLLELMKEEHGWKIWRKADAFVDLAQRLVAAETEPRQGAILNEDKDLVTPALVSALNDQGVAFRSQRDVPRARSSFQLMEKVAETTGDRKDLAAALRSVGDTFNMQGDHRKALEYYQKSLDVAKQTGDQLLVARATLNIGIAHAQMSQFGEAFPYFTDALRIAEAINDKLTMAKALNAMGTMSNIQGKSDEALPYHQRVLSIYEEQKQGPKVIAEALLNIGVDYKGVGNRARALEAYEKSLALLGPDGDKDDLQLLLNNIGSLYQSQGDQTVALDYYNRSLVISKQIDDKESIEVTLKNIGVVEEALAHYDAAFDYFQQSLALAEQVKDDWGSVFVLNHIAEVQALQGKPAEAMATYQKDLSQADSLEIPVASEMICTNIAELLFQEGKFEEALTFAQRASATAVKIADPEMLWESRTMEGAAQRHLNHAADARQALEESIAVVEDLRGKVAGGVEQQPGFFASKMRPYQEMMELLISQNQAAEALQYAERARGRALLDVLSSGRVNITKEMTDAEREKEQHLQEQLASLNKDVEKESSSSKPDSLHLQELTTDLEKARTEYREFLTALYSAHPQLQGMRGQMQPLSQQEIGQLLPDSGGALLEFAVGENSTRIFVLTVEKSGTAPHLEVYSAEVTATELEKKTEHLRGQIAQRDLAFRNSAQELYHLLLKPAEQQLRGKNTLIIVPDGSLWNLPFQALVSDRNRYLLEDYAISYAPSLTVLHEMIGLRKRRSGEPNATASTTLLAMGNPAVGKQITERAQLAYRGETLEPLPEAEKEVKMLALLYGAGQTKAYVGAAAREDVFKVEAGNARLLHLATHGFLNDSSPMYSHIVLSLVEGNSKEDGLLETWEIMQLDLRADLAVLSACETARGRVSAGEGVLGLAWAFFVAGTPTTVVSQWKVESSSTTELMTAFHRARKANLAHPQSVFATARALRGAELDLLHSKEYSHPFYWAPFVVVGDPN